MPQGFSFKESVVYAAEPCATLQGVNRPELLPKTDAATTPVIDVARSGLQLEIRSFHVFAALPQDLDE